MDPPEARLRLGACDVLAIGTVAGFVPDEARVRAAFAAHRPGAVALGVPPEDLAALDALSQSVGVAESLAPPDAFQERQLHLLGRFGATRVPSPDLEAAHALARGAGIPLAAVDLDDTQHSAAYVGAVKVWHLWRAPRREGRLLADEFSGARDAYELAVAWDRAAAATGPLRDLEALREARMADGVRTAAAVSARLLVIVPAARFDGMMARLNRA